MKWSQGPTTSEARNTGNKMDVVGKQCNYSRALLWILLPYIWLLDFLKLINIYYVLNRSQSTVNIVKFIIFTEIIYMNTLRKQQTRKFINPVIISKCFEGKEMTRTGCSIVKTEASLVVMKQGIHPRQ